MRYFDYKSHLEGGLLDEYIGDIENVFAKEERLRNTFNKYRDKFEKIRVNNLINCTLASLKIEGFTVSDDKVDLLSSPDFDIDSYDGQLTKADKEFLGYINILNMIQESYEYIGINPNVILQLHRDMLININRELGGKYRNACIYVNEITDEGRMLPYFEPVPAHETMRDLDELTRHYNSLNLGKGESLLASIMFLLDFYVIHPFNFANGEAMRLMAHLLFNKVGISIFKFVSLEEYMCDDIGRFYLAVRDSSRDYYQGKNNYDSIVRYFMDMLRISYIKIM